MKDITENVFWEHGYSLNIQARQQLPYIEIFAIYVYR